MIVGNEEIEEYILLEKKEKLKYLVKSKEDGTHRKRYFPLFFDMNMQVKFRVNSGDFIIPKYHPSAYFIKQIFYFTFVMTADDPIIGDLGLIRKRPKRLKPN